MVAAATGCVSVNGVGDAGGIRLGAAHAATPRSATSTGLTERRQLMVFSLPAPGQASSTLHMMSLVSWNAGVAKM